MAARNLVLFTDLENVIDRGANHRMIVVPGMTQLLAQIAFADQHHADSRHFLKSPRQIVDATGVLTLNNDEDFSVRCEGPDIRATVVLLLRQSPIARGACGSVATNAGRIVERRFFKSRITAGTNCIPSLFHCANMRKDDSVDADIEHLLGDPLIHLAAVRWNSNHGSDFWRQRFSLDNLAPVEHGLERLTQAGKIQRRVLHFEGDAVQRRACHGDGAFSIHWSKRSEGGFAFLQGFDYAVKPRYVWHVSDAPVFEIKRPIADSTGSDNRKPICRRRF